MGTRAMPVGRLSLRFAFLYAIVGHCNASSSPGSVSAEHGSVASSLPAQGRSASGIGHNALSDISQPYVTEASPRRLSAPLGGFISIVGVFLGVALWGVMVPALWNSEHIVLKHASLQGKSLHRAIKVEDANRNPLPEMEGRIVFVAGEARCKETLRDEYYPGVATENCLKLRRVVQMLQWVDSGAGVFKMEWKEELERRTHDDDDANESSEREMNRTKLNPPLPLPTQWRHVESCDIASYAACTEASEGSVKLGAYYLGSYVRHDMLKFTWVQKHLEEHQIEQCLAQGLGKLGQPTLWDRHGEQWWTYGSGEELGDVRVRFEELQCGPLSVCGVLTRTGNGHTFVPVIRETAIFSEPCAREFGCATCHVCGTGEVLVFSADPAEDEKLNLRLEGLDSRVELTDPERAGFRRRQSTYDSKFFYHAAQAEDPGHGLCCLWWLPKPKLADYLHYCGLQEEFLGAYQGEVRYEELLWELDQRWELKQCVARLLFLALGVFASWLLMSPFLDSGKTCAWYGVALSGLALCCTPCLSATIVTVAIISASWCKQRPRLVAALVSLAGLCLFFWLLFASAGCAGVSAVLMGADVPIEEETLASTPTPLASQHILGTQPPPGPTTTNSPELSRLPAGFPYRGNGFLTTAVPTFAVAAVGQLASSKARPAKVLPAGVFPFSVTPPPPKSNNASKPMQIGGSPVVQTQAPMGFPTFSRTPSPHVVPITPLPTVTPPPQWENPPRQQSES